MSARCREVQGPSATRLAARRLACAAAALSLLASTASAQGSADAREELLAPALRELLHEGLSGELAKEHVIAITRHHRIQGSRGYRDAAQYVLEQLRGFGYGEPTDAMSAAARELAAAGPGAGCSAAAGEAPTAWIESFPSDGRVVYQTWQSPSGWDIESAELRLMSPCDDPAGERLVGFPEIAMSVITYSNPGDVTAELVWVGSGEKEEDYAGKDVAGKFVLATGYGGAVHRLAVLGHGAAAVVCFLDDGRAADHPDMLQYTGMWPKTPELERTTFGFNLTHRQGARLRDLLLAGQKVTLRGWVRGTGLEPYFMDVVVAQIPGASRPDEVIAFSAHLDHPKESANDNASGSGAILDIARTLKQLIEEGRLPRPQRTLRFLWVPEWNGTMAYIDAHPEAVGPALGGRWLANLNMDMVGENLELLHSKLVLTRTPDSLPSCLNDVVENMAQMVDRMDVRTPRGSPSAFNWRMTPYSGGSDHMMFIDRKVPAVMFSHEPDYTHHTSEDTPDKVDPVELERCEIIAAGAGLFLSDLDRPATDGTTAAPALVERVAAGIASRTSRSILPLLRNRIENPPLLLRVQHDDELQAILLHRARELACLESVGTFASVESLGSSLETTSGLLFGLMDLPFLSTAHASEYPDLDLGSRRGDTRVPVRRTRGPLAFDLPESRLPPERAAFYGTPEGRISGDQKFELINFTDGVRTIDQIAFAVEQEFGPISRDAVTRFFSDLAEEALVGFEEGTR